MMKLTRIFGAAAVAAASLAPSAASAKIQCKDGYQIIKGEELATPFCQDENLADVARTYGVQVSGREMRTNLNRKAEVCRFIGHDIRVREACINFRNDFTRPESR